MILDFLPLWAVHISDGVLYWPVWLAGFLMLVVFVAIGLRSLAVESWKSTEDPITWTALLTAAFFVATLIHVKLGPTSAHLLLNGLVGLILGRRACLAIPVGIALQAFLLGHGGLSTIGINSCIMILPALLARPLYRYCHQSLAVGLKEMGLAVVCLLFPAAFALVPAATALSRLLGRWLNQGIDFVSGFLVGSVTVLMTAALTGAVLARGGEEDWTAVAILLVAAHLPLAVVEGVIIGFTCSFLAKVRPHLLPGHDSPATQSCENEAFFDAANSSALIPAEKLPQAALPTDLSPR
ncbi:MAG TPA: CbiM family transporter [Gemmataceae bacterium]|jgi:cobalt/nickel transport system permease protein|nr:CbiM family transporter [Gemmataceae bacterium]